METWDAIRSRRDVRRYADRPIADEDLERILEAGRRAPSSKNWQPWDFVVVTDRARLEELSRVWQGAGHVARSAATVVLVGPVLEGDEARRERILWFDLGQAALSLMLAAADLGIGAGHGAVRDQELARRVLGLPDDRFAAHLVPLGHPEERPLEPLRRPDRRPLEDVVHRETW